MTLLRSKNAEHLSARQRTRIRRSESSERYLAGVYGVSVATIRRVRATADDEHAARIAAIVRRMSPRVG